MLGRARKEGGAKCPSKSTSLMWPEGLAIWQGHGAVLPLTHTLTLPYSSYFVRQQRGWIHSFGRRKACLLRTLCQPHAPQGPDPSASSFLSHSMFSATSSIAPGSTAQPARGSSPLQQTPAVGTSTPSSAHDSLLASSAHPPSNTAKIWVHNEHYSKRDFLINPAFIPNLQPNDLFEVYDPGLPREQCKKLIIQWTGHDKDAQPGQV